MSVLDEYKDQKFHLVSDDGKEVDLVLQFEFENMLPLFMFVDKQRGNRYSVIFGEDHSTHFIALHEFVKFYEQMLGVVTPVEAIQKMEHFLLLRRQSMWLPDTELQSDFCSGCGSAHGSIYSYWVPAKTDGVLHTHWVQTCDAIHSVNTWDEGLALLADASALDESGVVREYLQKVEALHLIL